MTAEEYESAKILDDDIEGSKEERAFRFWINSLNEEASDGFILLKVIDKIKPGSVDWKKVEKNPNNTFKKGINCNVAIESAKKLNL